ncbi:MAG: hypothetical protein GJ676_01525 [Rhodobacteraceae bacterium]|nr:hypothetical protein [Paracoccaceae bacterium]
MRAIADTTALVQDGVLTPDQARIIEARSREVMVSLAVNSILCFGIIAATTGFIFWLADPLAVAITGVMMTAAGLIILKTRGDQLAIFGNSATLIGAGMLMGGACIELMDKHEALAGWVMMPAGALVSLLCAWRWRTGAWSSTFVLGAILLMGLAMHLAGIEWLMLENETASPTRNIVLLYYSIAIALVGWLLDVRFITAFAIAPFAQMLETGTSYFKAAYVFYSPESTLTILQMVLLIGLCIWWSRRLADRDARHLHVLAVMAFIVANASALVGSIWGDVVGETVWGPGYYSDGYADWQSFNEARDAFRDSALIISEGVYSVIWAIALAAVIGWAAQRHQRGLFNTALTFAAIHAYTQMFESFADEPLAYVIGGLAAIPLAWGLWRLNQWMTAQNG